jgi:hypothetical protein
MVWFIGIYTDLWAIFLCILNVYLHKNAACFEKPFFQRNISDSRKPLKAKILTFFTDKTPNIVSQYDLWTVTIFTSLGLALILAAATYIFHKNGYI